MNVKLLIVLHKKNKHFDTGKISWPKTENVSHYRVYSLSLPDTLVSREGLSIIGVIGEQYKTMFRKHGKSYHCPSLNNL